ncbi:hypothetical protein F3Y22_tig00110327pilonHSYRG00079 [Hibiscus syriacus]|uniref:Uncharacterized protein n=1 Tax=Hibiscus syriacus TaxID=106335 RepID=A0A6A3B4B3_HIBSY|nr:hypothetical protein F3Y22_tig00110327pilonHSYRG00079 [Hibiscus syriacus]
MTLISMKQVNGVVNGLICGLSFQVRSVAGDLFQLSECKGIRAVDFYVKQHLAEIGSFFLEPCILLNDTVVELRYVV